jgi:uncharacterized protein YndB with AHSA1/START domain
MAKNDVHTTGTEDREIVIRRLLNAPRELVYKVWTEAEHLAQWWGPNGFTITTNKLEVKPGGEWNVTMHGPDGTDYPNRIIFSEVVKPERLVYTHDSGIEDDPQQFFVTITFEAVEENKTMLTMYSLFKTAAARDYVVKEHGAIEGGNQTVNRLAEHLATLVTV